MTSHPAVRLTPTAPTRIRLAGVLLALALCVLGLGTPSAEAAFPGQNGLIAFDAYNLGTPFSQDIFTLNPNGIEETNLTNTSGTSREFSPAFSADGSKIAFFADRSPHAGNTEIYTMNADGTGQTRLTNRIGADESPAFSPDGKRIVFTRQLNTGKYDLFTMDAVDPDGDGNGNNLTRLTSSDVQESEPVFSPDGSKIALGKADGNLYTINADGSDETLVTSGASADYSPNGTKLTFTRGGEIYTINVNKTGESRLTTDGTFFDVAPAFSPDGSMIAFARVDSLGGEINNGLYTMNAIDGSGALKRSVNNNKDEMAPSWGVTPASADKLAPQTTITSGPTGATSDDTPTFEFSSSEANSTFECRVDNGAFAPCSSPHTTVPLSAGQHTFEVRATDVFGNTDQTPASRAFTVSTGISGDSIPPETTISSGPSDPSNDNTPTFEFSSTEAGTFACRVDDQPFAVCDSPHTTAVLSEGVHNFEVRATDESGNADPTPASRTFTVDTAAPQTTITNGPSGTTNDDTPTFEFSSSETGSTFACRVDSSAFAACSSPHTTVALSPGTHTFAVRATDAAGNIDATPDTRTFTVDTSAPGDTTSPETDITAGPSGETADNTPTFEFSSDETDSTFACRLDSDAFAACSSPLTTAQLSEGPHTFDVRATDAAGNVDATPARRSFTVNTSTSPPPDTTTTTPTTAPTTATTTTPIATTTPAPTPTPPVPAGQAQGPDTTRPLLSAMSFSRTRFRAARSGASIAAPGATRFSYGLSEPASVRFVVERALAGRRAGERCVRATRSNRRAKSCTRYALLRGSFTHPGKTGQNKLAFSGRLAGRKLAPGRYRLRAIATDAAGNKSVLKRSSFLIMRG